MLPALAAGALVARQPHLALAAALALPWEKGLEIGARKALPRFRPAQSDPAVRLRDDAPTEGPSYPSGHGGIAFAAVFLLAPCIPGPAAGALAALATATSFARVQQGAHYPADAVGGLLLGLTVASSLRSLVGHPA